MTDRRPDISDSELASEKAETLPERNVMSLLTGTSTTGSVLGSPDVLPGTDTTTSDGGLSDAATGTAADAGSVASTHLPASDGTYTPDATATATS